MSSPSTRAPSSATITASQMNQILSLYPTVVDAVYRRNSRLSKDRKRLAEALEDDAWRYEELPVILAERRKENSGGDGGGGGGGGWLEKAELERLVRWKITHGQHRPFLPALIRQNATEVVKSTTQVAFTGPQSAAYPQAALSTLTKGLKGVGPATATLILSLTRPAYVPFFSDELYVWLVLDGDVEDKLKLKYDLKEYKQLFERWVAFEAEHKSEGYRAVDLEKVAYVVGQWDVVGAEERRAVQGFGEAVREDGDAEGRVRGAGQKGFRKNEVDRGGLSDGNDVASVSRRSKKDEKAKIAGGTLKRKDQQDGGGEPAPEKQTITRRSKRLRSG